MGNKGTWKYGRGAMQAVATMSQEVDGGFACTRSGGMGKAGLDGESQN